MKNLDFILQTLADFHYEAYLVGGCVRDKVLGKEPHDYDIATNATPTQLASLFKTFDIGGTKFGVTCVLSGEEAFEVATYRKDTYDYNKGRNPVVEYGTSMIDDGLRRDFTINALYSDINGVIHDPSEMGMEDIKNRVIRFVYNSKDFTEYEGACLRIAEDKLRVLRAVRFLSTMPNFTIAEESARAITDSVKADDDFFKGISFERIGAELKRIVDGAFNVRSIMFMKQTGILKQILPEVDRLSMVHQSPRYHPEGDVFIHTLIALANCKEGDWLDKFACLLHDVGKYETLSVEHKNDDILYRFKAHDSVGATIAKDICKRLRFTTKDTETISHVISKHMDMNNFFSINLKKKHQLWTFLQDPLIDRIIKLSNADGYGKIWGGPSRPTTNRLSLVDDYMHYLNTPLPNKLIKGNDLIDLGIKPSKFLGAMENKMYEMQLNKGYDKNTLLREAKILLSQKAFVQKYS